MKHFFLILIIPLFLYSCINSIKRNKAHDYNNKINDNLVVYINKIEDDKSLLFRKALKRELEEAFKKVNVNAEILIIEDLTKLQNINQHNFLELYIEQKSLKQTNKSRLSEFIFTLKDPYIGKPVWKALIPVYYVPTNEKFLNSSAKSTSKYIIKVLQLDKLL